MRKNESISLELSKNEDVGVKFHVKQFDDVELDVRVYDGLDDIVLENQKINVFITKSDNTVIHQAQHIVLNDDNSLHIVLSKQATTCLGKCNIEVLLTDEEGTVSTQTVSYMVSEKLSNSIVEIIRSSNSIDVLNTIEEFIQNSNVDIVEIKECLSELKADLEGLEDDSNNLLNKVNDVILGLDEKINEGNDCIDELSELIEEAKRVIGLVRVFIDEKTQIDLSNYYTKDEVNALIDDLKYVEDDVVLIYNNIIEKLK